MELKICHLYPDVLNLYGDRGNIQCLQRRLAWRGIDCQVDFMGIGDYKSLSGYDLFFIGGGQDFDQEILLEDLRLRKGAEIRAALEDGKTFLCICGGYQMMGGWARNPAGASSLGSKTTAEGPFWAAGCIRWEGSSKRKEKSPFPGKRRGRPDTATTVWTARREPDTEMPSVPTATDLSCLKIRPLRTSFWKRHFKGNTVPAAWSLCRMDLKGLHMIRF